LEHSTVLTDKTKLIAELLPLFFAYSKNNHSAVGGQIISKKLVVRRLTF
jgi:hypothetical protein